VSAFAWPARVYWEDTDGAGVVYYANYLRFLERARTEWLRERGHVQTELAVAPGVLFAVAEVNIRYRRPARLDDLLLISCAPALEGAASVLFRQQIHRDGPAGELLVDADVRVVCVDTRDFRPRRVPASIVAELRS
jgi:acyl-CoA thioester hydrolase